MYVVHRTTIFIDTTLLRQARRRARQEGKSFAAVVREALAAYVAGTPSSADRLPSVTGRFGSGTSDTSERVDELLWAEPHR